MTKKTKQHSLRASVKAFFNDKRRVRKWALPTLFLVGAGAVVVTGLSIVVLLNANDKRVQNGVGADGFRAYVEDKGNIDAGALMTKDQVVAILGSKAASVGEASVGKVFNMNGDRSQALTYSFTRTDGMTSSVYVDKKIYKSADSMRNDNIYGATMSAGTINNLPAYYRLALTIGSDREYSVMAVNGLTVYRFVMAQPERKITISEIDADALLLKLAAKAQL